MHLFLLFIGLICSVSSNVADIESETPSIPHVTITSDPTDIVSQLLLNKRSQVLTDKLIVFHDHNYPCHSAFLSSFSSVLREKLLEADSEVNFPERDSIIPNAALLFQILDYCYGEPFELTLNNMGIVLTLCSSLQLPSLANPIHKIISEGFSKPVSLQLKPAEVVQQLYSSVQRDVVMNYKEKSFAISSLTLISVSEYFKNLLPLNFSHSEEMIFAYDQEFPDVSAPNFEIFVNYFHGKSFVLDVDNVIDFYQLTVFFQVEKVKQACNSFVSTLSSAEDILFCSKLFRNGTF
ncbi:hypothetical protein GEMRC1_005554 [Eukaryota sp. GEM-RC1]